MSNTTNYYRRNYLYSSHRLFIPESKQKAVNTCGKCRFYIIIIGREEKKMGCAALIPKYFAMKRKIPSEIDIGEFLKEIGKVGLQNAVTCCGEHLNACALFQPRNNPGS
ncbi:hypothetical protein L9W92_06005 [Pelotomaculum terephthalicicum JT]|uniref:hypothetical protein n=1 Tax=Pelotomaculum TaxID=191373 RepID=UPI0009C8F9C1|nr:MULTISPECIES: hypothetical protein [Pelotomaculum]MCG9967607.1 hypothetical protein [Pelotomaculum terephthalicicum JT]OPX91660.1 MAG: hypothetical protein A4E54_00157 [Pelotomaculum sp. PtaB.Bin117]OPY61838.1 MAG: hypothetical protein A4E56_01789 [Pelotomaculum sp. PtaU1.Bin065]